MSICTRIKEDRVLIEISDTGVGISADKLNKIFSHGFTTKAKGHGFGLHSCANAATEMNGKISVSSAGPMQGATFVLDLPLTEAALPCLVG
jgi:two-component system NtrC family sensor kinase